METRKGFFTKLGILGGIAVCMVYFGKKDIAHRKNQRHVEETKAAQLADEFDYKKNEPGMPMESGKYKRESEYVGSGLSYSSRKPGDRLTMLSFFGWK